MTTNQLHFDDISVGDAITTGTETVTQAQMFFFSAATYNGHRIHYDHPWATEVEGYPDVLVHGPLQAALMARALTDWVGPDGRLVEIAVQNRGSAHPGEALRFVGTVVAKRCEQDEALIDLEIRGEKGEDVVLMPGTATVALPA